MVKRNLATVLQDIMALTEKYEFNTKDKYTLLDRCLLLGEACYFLEELGLLEELKKRHIKACDEYVELVNKI